MGLCEFLLQFMVVQETFLVRFVRLRFIVISLQDILLFQLLYFSLAIQ